MRNKDLTHAQRLIVAADFSPKGPDGIRQALSRVMNLAAALKQTGVCLKVNSVLRAIGYQLIDLIHALDLAVFADLKPIDIHNTLKIDGEFLRHYSPEFLTVSCLAGIKSMRALKAELPDTEVLGVTVLTNLDDGDCADMFACRTDAAVMRLARQAAKAGIDGLICAPKEAKMLRAEFGDAFSLNTPGIRPAWAVVDGDDQNQDRVMTPTRAFLEADVDRVVVGRPITQAPDPYDAVMRTIEEIANVC